VLGDAAVLLPPSSPEAWAAKVLELLGDESTRATLIARGLARAATFTWERTAKLTHAIYEEALEGRS